MPELTARRGVRDDQGAVATMFAILLAGGVLLGFLALVIDVGQIYVERAELQGGADAAALAVARSCALDATACATNASMVALAQRYADSNASDGRTQVVGVCGRVAGRVDECPAATGNLTDCLGEPPAGSTPFVEVHLGTEGTGDRFVLPPVFAQTLVGNAQYPGAEVGACARASWTPRDHVSIVALAVSDCDVATATAGGFADPASPDPRDERVVELLPGHGNCPANPPGPWLRAGPAAWLLGDATCQVSGPAGAGVPGTAAEAAPSGCAARLGLARDAREVVYLPVYDMVSAGLPERTYHLVGLTPFLVTGWRLGPDPTDLARSWLRDPPPRVPTPSATAPTGTAPPATAPPALTPEPCGDAAGRCVVGVFVGAVIPLSDLARPGDPAASGSAIVTLIG